MTAGHMSVFTHVWHYVVARLLYDELVRPLLHGHVATIVLALACVCAVILVVRLTRRGA
jgi:hypothetical protein